MLKSTEDNCLAFYKSLILPPESLNRFRETFLSGIEEAFLTTFRSSDDRDIIIANYRDDFDEPVIIKNDFKQFLQSRIYKEEKIAIENIQSRADIILSSIEFNSQFFLFTDKTLVELNHSANILNYKSITESIIRMMRFFYENYNSYHSFSKSFLNTLETNRTTFEEKENNFTFKWRDKNRRTEIDFLYESLINAEPPFIESSKETFFRAFTDNSLYENEYVKWLCTNVKNHNVISKASLIFMLNTLFDEGYLKSDKNDLNKICVNVFCYPNGELLDNIKGTKTTLSKNPSRSVEIIEIISKLGNIN